ncbi:MAG: HAD family hydrolase [Hyphomicrobiaceae bacterium]
MFADVKPALGALKSQGYRIGISGNTSLETETAVAAANLAPDFIASSARWGVSKPACGFFERLMQECGTEAHEIAYVGDRLDNDVSGAIEAGMTGIWLKRGLWADFQGRQRDASFATATIDTLAQLPDVLGRLAPTPEV